MLQITEKPSRVQRLLALNHLFYASLSNKLYHIEFITWSVKILPCIFRGEACVLEFLKFIFSSWVPSEYKNMTHFRRVVRRQRSRWRLKSRNGLLQRRSFDATFWPKTSHFPPCFKTVRSMEKMSLGFFDDPFPRPMFEMVYMVPSKR